MSGSAPLIGDMTKAQMVILRGDVQRFARATPELSARALARPANLTEAPLRRIVDDEWAATDRTLRSLESAWHAHPSWQPQRTLDWRITGDADGYVLRRVVDPWTSAEFGDLAREWRSRTSDADFTAKALTDPRMSLIDVTPADPMDFVVLQHASAVSGYTGIDKTGITFRQNRTPIYRVAICADYRDCLAAGEPMACDIFWQVARFNDGSFYRRLLLPCGDRMVSVSLIQKWRFPIGWN